MFTDKTLYEASVLARDLTARGISLVTLPETPLFDLKSMSTPTTLIYENNDHLLDEIIKSSQIKDLDGVSGHSTALTQFTWGLSESLKSIISISRNEVNPMIKEAVCRIEKILNEDFTRNVGILIKPVFLPDILKNGSLDDLIERYKNSENIEVQWNGEAWPPMQADFLREAAKGKNRNIDAQIDTLLSTLDDDTVVAFYDYSFRMEDLPGDTISYNRTILNILTFLWASSWLIDLPEGINSTLKELSLNLVDLKSHAAKSIHVTMDKFERMSGQNNFILKMPNLKVDDKTYLVCGEIYNKWLADGGSPELLIGNFLSDDISVLNDLTEDKKKEYLRTYRLDVDMRRQEFDIKKGSVITKALSNYVNDQIELLNADKSIIRNRFNDRISYSPYREEIGLSKWIRKIICHVFFPNTDALSILTKIDSIMASDENMEPREAASLAAIDLVSEWLFSALKVELVS